MFYGFLQRGWATSSYDDNAKIYDAIAAATWKNFLNEGDGYGTNNKSYVER